MSVYETATFLSTMHRLEGEEALKKPLRVSPSRLPLESLKEAPEVFQPRDLARDTAAKEQHVRTLVNAIYSEPRNRLDPITVWWSGQESVTDANGEVWLKRCRIFPVMGQSAPRFAQTQIARWHQESFLRLPGAGRAFDLCTRTLTAGVGAVLNGALPAVPMVRAPWWFM